MNIYVYIYIYIYIVYIYIYMYMCVYTPTPMDSDVYYRRTPVFAPPTKLKRPVVSATAWARRCLRGQKRKRIEKKVLKVPCLRVK